MSNYSHYHSPLIHAADFAIGDKSDSESIRDCLAFSKQFKHRTIVFDRKDWHIDEAILIPSHTTVLIDGVTIKQTDYCFDNFFRADNMTIDPMNPYGYPVSIKPAYDIRIVGKNGAVLEGQERHRRMYNHLSKVEEEMVGGDYGWRGFFILISCCSNFEISGLEFRKQRSFGISVERSKFGHIHDLTFMSSCANGDGVHLYLGCSDMIVESIFGSTTDDLVALTTEVPFDVHDNFGRFIYPVVPSNILAENEPASDRDIHDITVQNLHTKGVSGVSLLARWGCKIYNILIQNVFDEHTEPFVHPLYIPWENPEERPNTSICYLVHSYAGYCPETFTPGDLHSIRINNVHSRFFKSAVSLKDEIGDLWINNVTQERKECGFAVQFAEKQDPNEIKITNCSGEVVKIVPAPPERYI